MITRGVWDHGQGTGRGQRGFEKRIERVAVRRQKMCVYEIFRAFAPWLSVWCKRNEETRVEERKKICKNRKKRQSWADQHVVSGWGTKSFNCFHSFSFHFSWWVVGATGWEGPVQNSIPSHRLVHLQTFPSQIWDIISLCLPQGFRLVGCAW